MLALWVDWVMDQMKGRRVPQLHFIWGEQWVQDRVLVDLDSHLHRQWVGTTCSQALVANNTNLVASRSDVFPSSFMLFLLFSFNILLHNWPLNWKSLNGLLSLFIYTLENIMILECTHIAWLAICILDCNMSSLSLPSLVAFVLSVVVRDLLWFRQIDSDNNYMKFQNEAYIDTRSRSQLIKLIIDSCRKQQQPKIAATNSWPNRTL